MPPVLLEVEGGDALPSEIFGIFAISHIFFSFHSVIFIVACIKTLAQLSTLHPVKGPPKENCLMLILSGRKLLRNEKRKQKIKKNDDHIVSKLRVLKLATSIHKNLRSFQAGS